MDRHARQARLAEVGSAGQARLRGARADVHLAGPAADVAVRYLAGAGLGHLRVPDAGLCVSARAVDPQVTVEVDGGLSPRPAEGFDLRDPAARDVAAGAAAALEAVRLALGLGTAERS
jgi:hypothetical protein